MPSGKFETQKSANVMACKGLALSNKLYLSLPLTVGSHVSQEALHVSNVSQDNKAGAVVLDLHHGNFENPSEKRNYTSTIIHIG